MPFSLKNNKDDVFLRSAIVSMISDLNDKVKIKYTNNDEQVESEYTVPFFIDLGVGSNDRFYRDFYYKNEDCDCIIVNNYDRTPRIHVTPNGFTTKIDEMTSPFGQIDYTKMINGREKWVRSFVHMFPVTIDLEFSAKADTITELFKIWQAIIDYSIFKSIPSNFVYNNINCESTITIEVPVIENTYSFTAEDLSSEVIGLNFSGQLDTFYPAIKDEFVNGIIKDFINSNKEDTDIPKNVKENSSKIYIDVTGGSVSPSQ